MQGFQKCHQIFSSFSRSRDTVHLMLSQHYISGTVADRENLKVALESSYMISYLCSIHILALECIFREISGFQEFYSKMTIYSHQRLCLKYRLDFYCLVYHF